jgi:hypothetical protein
MKPFFSAIDFQIEKAPNDYVFYANPLVREWICSIANAKVQPLIEENEKLKKRNRVAFERGLAVAKQRIAKEGK